MGPLSPQHPSAAVRAGRGVFPLLLVMHANQWTNTHTNQPTPKVMNSLDVAGAM